LKRAELKVRFVKSLHDFVLSLDDPAAESTDSQEFESTLRDRFNLHVEGDEDIKTASEKIEPEKALRAELASEQDQYKLLPQVRQILQRLRILQPMGWWELGFICFG